MPPPSLRSVMMRRYHRAANPSPPVFGQIEEARGFRRFSQGGLGKVGSGWGFVCTTHNLLKLFQYVTERGLIGGLSLAAEGG